MSMALMVAYQVFTDIHLVPSLKLIKLYTLSMYSFFHANPISIKWYGFFLIEVSTENVLSLFPGTKEKLFITSSAISAWIILVKSNYCCFIQCISMK